LPPAENGHEVYRARHAANQPAPVIRYRRPKDRRTRPQRWRDAVAELLALQAEDTATAEALRTIVELDLDALTDTVPPSGYGRD
jgi:hypothetical protein